MYKSAFPQLLISQLPSQITPLVFSYSKKKNATYQYAFWNIPTPSLLPSLYNASFNLQKFFEFHLIL